jgi:CPA2 family monovalent cation:H+ antiporter-2
MQGHFLTDIVIILALATGVLLLCSRFRIPTVVGLLLTGIVAGPQSAALVGAAAEVKALAEIGVILLLFAIGIEFSFKQLLSIGRAALLGGALQVASSIAAAFCIARPWGVPAGRSVFFGFLLALSSTAIVLKLLQQKGNIDTPEGKTALAVLIFQDIAVVPMMLVLPLLAGKGGLLTAGAWSTLLLKGVAIIAIVFVGAKWLVPSLLYLAAGTRSRELFLLTVVGLCLGVSWLTSLAGLSLALGAFLAGLIISESEYNHQALGSIVPFRDVFSSFFFVSIGMLFDPVFFVQRYGLILLLAVGVVAVKALAATLAVAFLGLPLRTAIIAALTLSQIGEFSFILSNAGLQYAILTQDQYQIVLAVSIITMAATPFLVAIAPATAQAVIRLPLLRTRTPRPSSRHAPSPRQRLQDHLIIVGFGVNGRNLARAARAAAIPYIIIEMNAETVRRERAKGEPIYFGDATQEAVLAHAGIGDARIVTIVINDAAATRRITELARRLNPKIHIVARTRYVQEVHALYRLGANEVVPEEFETAVEIFTRLLKKYLVPQSEIDKLVAEVRADGYQMFRSPSVSPTTVSDVLFHFPEAEVSTFRVAETSPCAGRRLSDIDLRRKYGITVVAIRRGSQMIFNPEGDMALEAGDTVVVMGKPEHLAGGVCLFEGQGP